MGQVVWKANLLAEGSQQVGMPRGATILTAALQGKDICIWFLCDPSQEIEPRRIRVAGTGHEIGGRVRYISTFQASDGKYIFHVFEELE